MKKDNVKEYAISAFRYYAKLGKPNPDELKRRIYNEALEKRKQEFISIKGISKPTEAAVLRAEREVENREAELLDVLAVYRTLERLDANDYTGTIEALEIVYFSNSKDKLHKGDIEMSVHKAEIMIPASRAQIYRWLKRARDYFAEERKLRKD